jgi:hypothetical protein
VSYSAGLSGGVKKINEDVLVWMKAFPSFEQFMFGAQEV